MRTNQLTSCTLSLRDSSLATYLHTDYVATLLPPTVKKYKSSPISGFFLLHNTVENTVCVCVCLRVCV